MTAPSPQTPGPGVTPSTNGAGPRPAATAAGGSVPPEPLVVVDNPDYTEDEIAALAVIVELARMQQADEKLVPPRGHRTGWGAPEDRLRRRTGSLGGSTFRTQNW